MIDWTTPTDRLANVSVTRRTFHSGRKRTFAYFGFGLLMLVPAHVAHKAHDPWLMWSMIAACLLIAFAPILFDPAPDEDEFYSHFPLVAPAKPLPAESPATSPEARAAVSGATGER